MIFDSTVTYPVGKDPESFSYIHEPKVEDSEHEEKIVSAVQSVMMFKRIAVAFGVPIHIEGKIASDETIVSYPELQDAGARATIVQKNRIRRFSMQ